MTKMTTEEAFVKVLQMHGIEHAFGIIGSAFMPISDLFPKAGITFWDVAHETNGGMICDGYTRTTGKMGMAIAQNGPGITGFVTAHQLAYQKYGRRSAYYFQKRLYSRSQPPLAVGYHFGDEALERTLGGVCAYLEQAVDDKYGGEVAEQADAGQKQGSRSGAYQDIRAAPPPVETGAVADGAGYRLDKHRQ